MDLLHPPLRPILYNQECLLCFEDIEVDIRQVDPTQVDQNALDYNMLSLSCRHVVHLTCAVQWEKFFLEKNKSYILRCPMCQERMILPNIVHHYQRAPQLLQPLGLIAIGGMVMATPRYMLEGFFNETCCILVYLTVLSIIAKTAEIKRVRKSLTLFLVYINRAGPPL